MITQEKADEIVSTFESMLASANAHMDRVLVEAAVRAEEAFRLRGQADALHGFAQTYAPMLSAHLCMALHGVVDAQLRLAHALTLPPTRFRSG